MNDQRFAILWGNDEHSIILVRLSIGWQWLDFELAVDEYLKMMDSVKHRVHLIIFTQDALIEVPPNALMHLPRLMKMTHPREDKTIIVGHFPIFTTLLNIIRQLPGMKRYVDNFWFAPTLAAAYEKLAEYERSTASR